MRKKGLFAGAVALLAAGTGAQAFEVQQYLGFADGSLEAIRAHMAGVAPAATATTDRVDFSDYGDADGEFPGTLPFPAAGGYTGNDGVNDNFVLRATGSFTTEVPGRFVFKTRNDDAAYLLIDGQVVIADGSFHPPGETWGEIALKPGRHTMDLYFIEVSGGALIEVSNERPQGGYDLVVEGGTLAPKYPDDPADATVGTVAAASETAASLPDQTLGLWSQSFAINGRNRTVSVLSTPEAVLVYVNGPFSGGRGAPELFSCTAIFIPAARFDAMREDGNDCNDLGEPFVINGLDDQGRLVVTGKVRETEYAYPLAFLAGPETALSVVPTTALDLAGVALGPSVAETMDSISAAAPPAGDPGPTSAFAYIPSAVYIDVPDRPGWTSVSNGPADAFLRYATPDADPADVLDFAEEEWLILSRESAVVEPRGLVGGEARPWGIVRVWTPAWDDRPTVETLHKALEAKYGAPSWMQTLGGGYGVRLVWSFDPAGEPLGAQDAERCSSAFVGRRPLGALHLASLDYRGSALPDLEFVTREGCGVQLVVSHPNVTRPIDPVAPVVFAIYDPQSALVTRWTRQLERLAADMSYARQSIDQAAAERAERDGRQPDL